MWRDTAGSVAVWFGRHGGEWSGVTRFVESWPVRSGTVRRREVSSGLVRQVGRG